MSVKRPFFILLLVCLLSALLGWGLASKQASDRINDTAANEVLAKQAEQVEAKRIADHVAFLVHSADEAVLSFLAAGGEKDVHLTDPVWISQLADAISHTFCAPTAHGLWISFPAIKFYRNGKPVLELMMSGNILRVSHAGNSRDFHIDQECAATIISALKNKGAQLTIIR